MTFYDEQPQGLGGNYVYFWREPEWNAWKVGKGDPNTRMLDYAEKNNLQYDPESLRCFAVSSGALAYRIEQLLHVALVENHGFRRFPGKGRGLELFLAPDGIDVPHTLTEIITRTIGSVDCGADSWSQTTAFGLLDASVVLPPQTTPSFFYDFLLSEGFTRPQILRRDIPINVLDELEERYGRRFEPQFIARRQRDAAYQVEPASPGDGARQQELKLEVATVGVSSWPSSEHYAESEPVAPNENKGGYFNGAVWLGVMIFGCVMFYRSYLAPTPTAPTPAAVTPPEPAVQPTIQIQTRPTTSTVPVTTPFTGLPEPANTSRVPPKRSTDLNLICFPNSTDQIVRATVSVKDGKFAVVHVAATGQRYDRSTQYEMSGTATRWGGVSLRNANIRMVGELYKNGSQTRYRETVYKNGSEAISSTDMRCE